MRVTLYDVDETLIIKKTKNGKTCYGLNKLLINDGKNDKCDYRFLFTNMDLVDIDKIAYKTELSSDINTISRHDLLKLLESEGILIRGVITPADVPYNHGPGNAFADIYEKAYAACLTDPNRYINEKRDPTSYNQRYMRLINELSTLPDYASYEKYVPQFNPEVMTEREYNTHKKAAIQKCLMADYFIKCMLTQFTELTLNYYDDDCYCLTAVENLCKQKSICITVTLVSNQNNLPLLIPGYESFITISHHWERTACLYPAKLPRDSIKHLVEDELKQLDILCEYIPYIKAKVVKGLNESETSLQDLSTLLCTDPFTARQRMVTAIAMIVGDNLRHAMTSKPYTENQIAFVSSYTDINIFDFFPDIIDDLLLWKTDEIAIKKELEKNVAAMLLSSKKLYKSFKETNSSNNMSAIDELLKKNESDIFSFWNIRKKKTILEYSNEIKILTAFLSKHSNTTNQNKAHTSTDEHSLVL